MYCVERTSWRAAHSSMRSFTASATLQWCHSSRTWAKTPLQSIKSITQMEAVSHLMINNKPSLAFLREVLTKPEFKVLCVFLFLLEKQDISIAFVSRTKCWIFPSIFLTDPTRLATVFKGFLTQVTPACVSGPVPVGITSPYSSSVTLSATRAAVSAAWSRERCPFLWQGVRTGWS